MSKGAGLTTRAFKCLAVALAAAMLATLLAAGPASASHRVVLWSIGETDDIALNVRFSNDGA